MDIFGRRMHPRSYFFLSLFILLVAIFLLATASPILIKPLLEEPYFPIGTLTTWLGFIALPTAIYFGISSTTQKWIKAILKVIIVISVFWGFIAYAIAGNWNYAFEGQSTLIGSIEDSEVFWNFNYYLIGASLITLLVHLILKLRSRLIR